MQYCQQKDIRGVEHRGHLTSATASARCIVMAMQALLDNGDEVLIPAPDYPLWTAAVNLSGGTPVHYLCDEESGWLPDIEDIEKKITPNTRGIVVINPNNPTGALYPQEVLQEIVEIAREHGLIVFSDEIYDKILYDGDKHVSIASLADDVLFITMSGLSKAYRIAGFRAGWMVVSGDKKARAPISSRGSTCSRPCACAATCRRSRSSRPRSAATRASTTSSRRAAGCMSSARCAYERVSDDPGHFVCEAEGRVLPISEDSTSKKFNITDDVQFAYDLLREEKVLIVQGTGFNWPEPDHFRIVFLPPVEDLAEVMEKLKRFLATYRQR